MSEIKTTLSVILVGDTEVGKTSIIKFFINNSFDPLEKNTIGALFHTFKTEIKGEPVVVQIWDTAGQEKFRSLGPIYYRKAQAAIVVYDVTNQKSFDTLDQWILDVKKNTVQAIFYIVGNKSDLESKVSQEDAQDFASEKEAKLFITSAKTGENIELMFNTLFEDIYNEVTHISKPNISTPIDEENHTKSSCC